MATYATTETRTRPPVTTSAPAPRPDSTDEIFRPRQRTQQSPSNVARVEHDTEPPLTAPTPWRPASASGTVGREPAYSVGSPGRSPSPGQMPEEFASPVPLYIHPQHGEHHPDYVQRVTHKDMRRRALAPGLDNSERQRVWVQEEFRENIQQIANVAEAAFGRDNAMRGMMQAFQNWVEDDGIVVMDRNRALNPRTFNPYGQPATTRPPDPYNRRTYTLPTRFDLNQPYQPAFPGGGGPPGGARSRWSRTTRRRSAGGARSRGSRTTGRRVRPKTTTTGTRRASIRLLA